MTQPSTQITHDPVADRVSWNFAENLFQWC
jgi:hypothetical protein